MSVEVWRFAIAPPPAPKGVIPRLGLELLPPCAATALGEAERCAAGGAGDDVVLWEGDEGA